LKWEGDAFSRDSTPSKNYKIRAILATLIEKIKMLGLHRYIRETMHYLMIAWLLKNR
jgi:hypothetical protein